MRIYEYGCDHEKIILMFQCAVEPTWIFEAPARALAKQFHVFLAGADGHDPSEHTTFTTVEDYASKAVHALKERGINHLDGLYGVSMGGAAALYLLGNHLIPVEKAIIDGGITPSSYPKWIDQLISLRDDCLIPFATISLSEMKAIMPMERWTPERKDPQEHYQKLYAYLKHHYSKRTNHNVFWSANHYDMPDVIHTDAQLVYWYGEEEKKERKHDLAYMKKAFPQTEFVEMPGYAHAELVMIHPALFAKEAGLFFK